MSKAKVDAWMPLFVADWDLSTGHLSCEQDGAYGRLVRWYWRNGAPPRDDDTVLASIVRADLRSWRRMRPVLSTFFAIEGGLWVHRRVERELVAWSDRKTLAAERAKAAAQKRWGKGQGGCSEHAPSNAPSMLEECPLPPSTEVRAPNEALTLCERDAPILPHEGQSAPALEEMTADERRTYAEGILKSLGPKRRAV